MTKNTLGRSWFVRIIIVLLIGLGSAIVYVWYRSSKMNVVLSNNEQKITTNQTSVTQSTQPDFQSYFSQFKQSLDADDVSKIADFINFPFYVYGAAHSRADFINDKNDQVNFFDSYVREQIISSTADDLVSYKNKSEMGVNDPNFALIPALAEITELDITNQHGGPAMRLIFAKVDNGFKLFCLTQ